MAPSVTPTDLFNPGATDDFFSTKDLESFDPKLTRTFSRRNAIWLAEFSRLIYRQGTDESKEAAGKRTRAEILADGWRETDFILERGTQAAILVNDKLQCACVVFRGTLGFQDMVSDARLLAVRWQGKGHVHLGFKEALDSAWPHLEARLKEIRQPVFFTGHSLGGALATLAAARTLNSPELNSPAAVYSFGSPRVGDEAFGRVFADLFHCRVVNDHDIVTTVPPAFSLPLFPVYQHTGEMHRLVPGGTMEIFPNGFDVRNTRQPASGVIDFMKTLRRLIEDAQAGGPVPQTLMDHAPVNYVAHLEQVAPSQP
jgi:hypothetical protein